MTPPLLATRLSRQFDHFQALAPTTLELEPGTLTLLTGPNGAGKSTLLLCLSGLLRPSSGSVHICGYDLFGEEREAKRRLAYVPDVPRFYAELTAWEHIHFIRCAHQVDKRLKGQVEPILKDFGLWDAKSLFPHNLSRGMRLKLGIVLGLIRPFEVLLLDEPTSALDAESIPVLIRYLTGVREQGKAILLATHNPELFSSQADRILSMAAGEVRDG